MEKTYVPLRIGTVPYCNAWPLTHYLPNELNGAVISSWAPSAMRLRLMAHHLDLALMPVAELMNIPYGKIIGNSCIACRGNVKSVRLLSHKPIEEIKTLALDTASRSSITMCELILRHFYDLRPVRYRLSDDRPLEKCRTDALVVIGDRALACGAATHWKYQYDLGELWREKTGLPFVFAAWVGCTGRAWDNRDLMHSLQIARDRSLADINSLLDEKAALQVPYPIARSEMYDYLTQSIVYQLGHEERAGMQSFFDLALLCGLTKHRTVVEMVE